MSAFTALTRATYAIEEMLSGQYYSLGLTPRQFYVLEELLRCGPQATGDIAEKVSFGDSTMSTVARNLVKAGLVTRREDERDGRKCIIALTREGRAAVEEALPRRAEIVHARMATLGKREQENLERMCDKLAECDPVKFVREIMRKEEEE